MIFSFFSSHFDPKLTVQATVKVIDQIGTLSVDS